MDTLLEINTNTNWYKKCQVKIKEQTTEKGLLFLLLFCVVLLANSIYF